MKQLFKPLLCIGILLTGAETRTDSCFATNGCTTANFAPCGNPNTNTVNNRNCKRDCDLSCSTSNITCCSPRSYYAARSAGSNEARELIGWQEYIYRMPESCDTYGAFAISYEYQRTFRPERIANYLFCTNTLRFVGSQVSNRDNLRGTQLVAENFGLPSTFNQSLRISPRITNHIVDFQFFLGLDSWMRGLYISAYGPLVITRWSLFDCCNSALVNKCAGSCSSKNRRCKNSIAPAFAPAGAYGINLPNVLAPVAVLNNLQDALSGNTFGAMTQPWEFGRFPFCSQRKVRLADVDVRLGWNWWGCDSSHIGAFIQFVAPTGNKSNPRYIFSPVVGNGRFWELGGGLSAHTFLWEGCGDQSLGVYFEGNATHLFRSRQVRSFDFKRNGPLSRYLLLKEIGTTNTPNAFNGTLINAINVTTRNTDVSIRVRGDAAIKFAYRNCGWGLDLGYNIYGQTREKVCIKRGNACGLSFDPNAAFVVQGGQPTQGFLACSGSTLSSTGTTVLNLNSAQANATIFTNNTPPPAPGQTELAVATGTDTFIPNAGVIAANPFEGSAIGESVNLPAEICTRPGQNELVLTPQAVARLGTTIPVPSIAAALPGDIASATVGNTAVPGVFTYSDISVLDPRSGAARSILTHKFFGFINYNMGDCGFIGIGGEVEVDGRRCNNDGHNQWGIIVKTGFSF